MTAPFATTLLGWKPSGKNKLGWTLVPNFADVDSAESMRIAAGVLDQLAVARVSVSVVPKDPGIAVRVWARELGIKEAWAEAIYEDVPPPLIYEWTNPRYTYSLVKGSPLDRRLGFLATFLFDEKLISQPVDVNDAMDASVIAEVLKTRRILVSTLW